MTESQLYDVLYDWRTEMMCVRLDERVGTLLWLGSCLGVADKRAVMRSCW